MARKAAAKRRKKYPPTPLNSHPRPYDKARARSLPPDRASTIQQTYYNDENIWPRETPSKTKAPPRPMPQFDPWGRESRYT